MKLEHIFALDLEFSQRGKVHGVQNGCPPPRRNGGVSVAYPFKRGGAGR